MSSNIVLFIWHIVAQNSLHIDQLWKNVSTAKINSSENNNPVVETFAELWAKHEQWFVVSLSRVAHVWRYNMKFWSLCQDKRHAEFCKPAKKCSQADSESKQTWNHSLVDFHFRFSYVRSHEGQIQGAET